MAAKRIRVSLDDVTYYTLPGSTGSFRTEMANVNDTIFGQNYQSESPTIGMWQVGGQAFFKGVAGYSAALKVGGTPTAVVAGPATLVSGKTYRINDAAKRVMSLANAITVYDNAVNHTDDVLSIDHLNGEVTFEAAYTVTGAVTVDYYYLPMAALAKARSFSLTQTAAEIDDTDYATAQANGGWRTYDPGLKTVGLEIGNIWAAANDFVDTLAARSQIYVEVSPNNTAGNAVTQVMFRGFFKYNQQNQQGNVGALEEETLTLGLYVPTGELVALPFQWYFGSANALPPAVQLVLDAWQDGTTIYVEYLGDGVAGKTGQAIVTEASLQNSFDGQNEFSFTLKGTGAPADA
jgi:hypothetical protein